MTTYAFPNIVPTTQTFELVTNTKTFQSPLTNSVQTLSRKGTHWKTTMTFNNLSNEDRGILQAFISKLNGQEHRMSIRDFGYKKLGSGPDNDSVSSLSAYSGSSMTIKSTTPSISQYFKTGDFISVNNELKIVTSNASSNSSGQVLVNFAPPLRNTTAADDVVDTFTAAKAVFMMTNNPVWRTQAPYFSSITIEAIEDVLA